MSFISHINTHTHTYTHTRDVHQLRWVSIKKSNIWGFPGGAVVRNPRANAEDTG